MKIRKPDLWGTMSNGQIIDLYDVEIIYNASNQAVWMLGSHTPYAIQTQYPETYTLKFSRPRSNDIDEYLASNNARLVINNISFSIESSKKTSDVTDYIDYVAIGYPIQIAVTIPKDNIPCFSGWEDVGYDYSDNDR